MPGDPLAQGLTAEGHRGRCRRVIHRGGDGRGLEQERELGVPRVERQRRAIEDLDRLPESLRTAEAGSEHHRCVHGSRGVRRSVHGPLQVLLPVGMPNAGLGHPQVEQQCRPVARRRLFGERAT